MYILAVLLPPVAVAIHTDLGMPTVWNILWTLLAWLPGVIHAFYILQQ
ncbi:MAG: YqaE/Pmp3 family membrane protein [Bacteroidetes bacterium]|nr:YqaE/Pmp3 family membrane protein [Bacteroidota bacterium]MBK8343624.1 YqaE/Pmp3 family membrane protein [Bacteroidota bacterium]